MLDSGSWPDPWKGCGLEGGEDHSNIAGSGNHEGIEAGSGGEEEEALGRERETEAEGEESKGSRTPLSNMSDTEASRASSLPSALDASQNSFVGVPDGGIVLLMHRRDGSRARIDCEASSKK